MTFLKSLPNLFFGLNTAFTLGFVIGYLTGDGYTYSSYDGMIFQAIYLAGWTLSWLPGGFWKAFFEILPYVIFWNAMTDL